ERREASRTGHFTARAGPRSGPTRVVPRPHPPTRRTSSLDHQHPDRRGPPLMAKSTPLPHKVDLPALDHEILQFWQDENIFDRSVERTAGGQPWVFYEGPPTANGQPGVHHVEA